MYTKKIQVTRGVFHIEIVPSFRLDKESQQTTSEVVVAELERRRNKSMAKTVLLLSITREIVPLARFFRSSTPES